MREFHPFVPFPGMLHSPSSFEVSKPSLAGISRCVQENSSTPGRLNLHSHSMISCCYRSAPMRQRFTLLLTCSIRSRRWLRAWFASCCSSVSSRPGSDIHVMLANSFHAMVGSNRLSKQGVNHGYGHPRGLSSLQVLHI